MREKRLYVRCDRCGKEISLREVPVTVTSNRKLASYEDLPEGWEHVDNKDFCPDCAKKYHNMMENFYGK